MYIRVKTKCIFLLHSTSNVIEVFIKFSCMKDLWHMYIYRFVLATYKSRMRDLALISFHNFDIGGSCLDNFTSDKSWSSRHSVINYRRSRSPSLIRTRMIKKKHELRRVEHATSSFSIVRGNSKIKSGPCSFRHDDKINRCT